jgi:hypothetical protein
MHWVTFDFRLLSHTIALSNITGKHTGELISDEHIVPLLTKWKIKSKVVGITTDNGINHELIYSYNVLKIIYIMVMFFS